VHAVPAAAARLRGAGAGVKGTRAGGAGGCVPAARLSRPWARGPGLRFEFPVARGGRALTAACSAGGVLRGSVHHLLHVCTSGDCQPRAAGGHREQVAAVLPLVPARPPPRNPVRARMFVRCACRQRLLATSAHAGATMHAQRHTCTCTHAPTCACARTHMRTKRMTCRTHIHTHIHAYTLAHAHAHARTRTRARAHTHTHTHTLAITHTQLHEIGEGGERKGHAKMQ